MTRDWRVDVSGQGIQVGDDTVQVNNWYVGAASTLGRLNPDTAADRLRQLPYREALDLLGQSSPADAADAVAALLRKDEDLLVALLTDLNPQVAEAFIATLAPRAPWLARLATAVEAIAAVAGAHRWEGGQALRAAHSGARGDGFFRAYPDGLICWSSRGAFAVPSVLSKCYETLGGPGSEYGFPVATARETRFLSGATAWIQAFQGGFVSSSRHGTFGTPWVLAVRLEEEGGVGGWLGYPVSAARGGSIPSQAFEGGYLLSGDGHVSAVRKIGRRG